jgi:hypothetical protein
LGQGETAERDTDAKECKLPHIAKLGDARREHALLIKQLDRDALNRVPSLTDE